MLNKNQLITDLKGMFEDVIPNENTCVEFLKESLYGYQVKIKINDYVCVTTFLFIDHQEPLSLKREFIRLLSGYASFQLTSYKGLSCNQK